MPNVAVASCDVYATTSDLPDGADTIKHQLSVDAVRHQL